MENFVTMLMDSYRYYDLAKGATDPKMRTEYWDLVLINDIQRKFPDAWFECGFAYYEMGDYQTAIERLNPATEDDPSPYRAYNTRGCAKDELKDYLGAIIDLTKAIELKPDYFEAYANRSTGRAILEDFPGALSDIEMAIMMKPNLNTLYLQRGILYFNFKKFNESAKDFAKSLSLTPPENKTQIDHIDSLVKKAVEKARLNY